MYQGKILFSDLDGTLLDKNREVSAKNLEAITHFVNNGGKFGIATGRDIENVLKLLSHVPVNYHCIFSNGSVLYDTKEKKILAERTLDGNILIPFLKKCLQERPDIALQVHTDQGTIFCPDDSQVNPSTLPTYQPYTCKSLDEIESLTMRKVLFMTKDGDMSWLMEHSEHLSNVMQRVQTSKVYYEFYPKTQARVP